MSASNSVINPTAIVLTPMRVTFNGVDLGSTEGGVTVHVKYDLADVMIDQFGKTPLTSKVSGQAYSVKLVLSETADKSKWKVAFPHAKLVGTIPNQSVYFDMQIGDDLLARSSTLLLHPLSLVDADLSQDILIYKAGATSAVELKYGPEKQVGLSVEFKVYPDTSVIPAKLMLYGDPSNGVVHATIAAAVAAGGNTGNGTIGTEVAYDAGTKTETLTVLCVGQTGGNNFDVSGSISGALGPIHLAAASGSTASFVSPEASFVITQGTIQFANGDSFTIATTAANYV